MPEDIEGGNDHVEISSGSTDRPIVPAGVLELDHVYEALGHSRRRYLCYTLLEDTEWSLDDLASKIAAWESDVPAGAVPEDEKRNVYISLYHAHVPKLVEDSIVTFDEDSRTISMGPNAIQVLQALHGMGASVDAGQETHARSELDE